MECQIQVNNKVFSATQGESILEVLRRNGIYVPTLCNLKNLFPTGACRLCMVELKPQGQLVPACSQPVEPNMIIETHSNTVTNARKTIIELLLSRHPDDCLYCERNSNCELQVLAYEMNVREKKISSVKKFPSKDLSSQSIHRDPSKCILCGRCVRICKNIIACNTLDFSGRGKDYAISTAFQQRLNSSNCINCGQCVVSCPTAALTDKINILPIQKNLSSDDKKTIAFFDPLLSLAVQNFVGKKNKKSAELINGILYSMGFDQVRNIGFAIDLYIIAIAVEFFDFINNKTSGVFYSSYCPSWVKYAEQYFHDDLDNLSKVQTPSMLFGNLIKNEFKTDDAKQNSPVVVSFEPCTSRKFESRSGSFSDSGFHSVDFSATFREFFQMMRIYGVQSEKVNSRQFDGVNMINSSSVSLLSVPGGLLTAVCRTLVKLYPSVIKIKSSGRLEGGKIYKKYSLKINDKEVKFVSINGMSEALNFIEKLRKGIEKADFVEVLACPSGCLNGGGLSLGLDKDSQVRAFQKSICDLDQISNIQSSALNENAYRAYNELLNGNSDFQKVFKKRNVLK